MIIFSATGSLMEDFKRSITRVVEGVKLPSPTRLRNTNMGFTMREVKEEVPSPTLPIGTVL